LWHCSIETQPSWAVGAYSYTLRPVIQVWEKPFNETVWYVLMGIRGQNCSNTPYKLHLVLTAVSMTEAVMLLVLVCRMVYRCACDRKLAMNILSNYQKHFYLAVSWTQCVVTADLRFKIFFVTNLTNVIAWHVQTGDEEEHKFSRNEWSQNFEVQSQIFRTKT